MTSYPTAKRVLDKAVASVMLVLLAPVFGVVAGAMGVDMLARSGDRGPWLYRERRVSRGREFELLKFRTLRQEVLDAASGDEAHARLYEADSANLTWAGRRLLKPWYLDELPQIWNVLRGDMSLVGPRPWPPSMVASQVQKGLAYRDEFIAGWTGPAQVRKGVTESAGYTELDLEYVTTCRNSSAWQLLRLDIELLGRTVAVLARSEGLDY